RQLEDHLYRTEALKLLRCETLDQVSLPDEAEEAFRARLREAGAVLHARERDQLTETYTKQLVKIEARIEKYQSKLNTQRWQFFARVGGVLWVVLEGVLRAMGRGRAGRPRSAGAALRYAATEHGQQATARIDLDNVLQEKQRLEESHADRLRELESTFLPENLKLEPFELRPLKSDIEVDRVVLAWLPWRIG